MNSKKMFLYVFLAIGLALIGIGLMQLIKSMSVEHETHSIGDLSMSQPYHVVGHGNLQNDNLTRRAGLWYITAPAANSFAEYAQTAIRAALDLYNYYRLDYTSVLLLPSADIATPYAQASYASDGLGAAGMTGSVEAVPMYWRVWVMDDQPFSPGELEIACLWQQKMADFPKTDMLSSCSYDEKALRRYISQTLNVSYEQTAVRQLKMRDYHYVD